MKPDFKEIKGFKGFEKLIWTLYNFLIIKTFIINFLIVTPIILIIAPIFIYFITRLFVLILPWVLLILYLNLNIIIRLFDLKVIPFITCIKTN